MSAKEIEILYVRQAWLFCEQRHAFVQRLRFYCEANVQLYRKWAASAEAFAERFRCASGEFETAAAVWPADTPLELSPAAQWLSAFDRLTMQTATQCFDQLALMISAPGQLPNSLVDSIETLTALRDRYAQKVNEYPDVIEL